MERSAFVFTGCGLWQTRGARWIGAGADRLYRYRALTSRSRYIHASSTSADVPRQQRTGKAKPDNGPYSKTVNLPQTEFSQRANSGQREPELQEFWQKERIYERLSRENVGDAFVLHDGPPFANGPLHCGHALNKLLKDFIVRYKLLRGRKAVFVPGWDTHGLPIELKVLQSIKSKDRKDMSILDMRKKAEKFALDAVENQAAGFQRFGVWGDWGDPYLTLRPKYEAAQIGVFGDMFLKGYIYRGRKPVHWSPSSRTALAEAELEYPEGHVSKSCFCAFKAVSAPASAPDEVKAALCQETLHLAIWTTTPWTIPANRAVAVNAKLTYALVRGLDSRHPDHIHIVAKDLINSVREKFDKVSDSGSEVDANESSKELPRIVAIALGRDLIGIEYAHALQDGLVCRVVEGGDYITTEAGTGLVHTAPGHGQEDYLTGLREGLEVVSPVDEAGRFTEEAANGKFAGLSVLGEGNDAVLAALKESSVLLCEERYSHKYPYDWRTKKPTIFRATEQWFASIDGFRDDALNAIETVKWIPEAGIKRIRGMVEGRGDWCLSRQRSWGLPIPVFYDDDSGDAIMTRDTIDHIRNIVAERGSNAWWELDSDELLPAAYRGRNLRKGMDTMDVWFDSGTSWAAVVEDRETLQYPADMYLEGSDQHRGWFQSSLLTSVATRGMAPYKSVLTHGFVLDERGVKMSKSLGNVVDPLQVISGGKNQKTDPPYGADVLRLWVASADYTGDVLIGPLILKQTSDVYRKLRNTIRYMVGNLYDFEPEKHHVRFDALPSLDQFMLLKMQDLITEIEEAYESFSFYRAYQALQRFAVVELSNFYLDIAKDRLYIPDPDSFRRRSCQTVLADTLETFAKLLAPLVPHLAEDLWQNLPYRPKSFNDAFSDPKSIFQAGWVFDPSASPISMDPNVKVAWDIVLELRDDVNKVLEGARSQKYIGASMEGCLTICAFDPIEQGYLQKLNEFANDVDSLKRALIVSGVNVVQSSEIIRHCAHHNLPDDPDFTPRFSVGVDRATTSKCDRCWHYDETVGQSLTHPLLCGRCADAVLKMGILSEPVEISAASVL